MSNVFDKHFDHFDNSNILKVAQKKIISYFYLINPSQWLYQSTVLSNRHLSTFTSSIFLAIKCNRC